MSAELTTGLLTLGGVLVGGLLNFAATAAIEERRGKRALRTAARVVDEEVSTNEAIIFATTEVGDWSPMGNAPLSINAWQHYRHSLADRLPGDDWEILRVAMRQTQMIDRVHKLGKSSRPFSPMDPPHLSDARQALQGASEMLRRYSESDPDPI